MRTLDKQRQGQPATANEGVTNLDLIGTLDKQQRLTNLDLDVKQQQRLTNLDLIRSLDKQQRLTNLDQDVKQQQRLTNLDLIRMLDKQ